MDRQTDRQHWKHTTAIELCLFFKTQSIDLSILWGSSPGSKSCYLLFCLYKPITEHLQQFLPLRSPPRQAVIISRLNLPLHVVSQCTHCCQLHIRFLYLTLLWVISTSKRQPAKLSLIKSHIRLPPSYQLWDATKHSIMESNVHSLRLVAEQNALVIYAKWTITRF